jgi:hypothetical protein
LISIFFAVPCLGEQVGHLFLALVQRRPDDVRRRLIVVDLQDVFAEVGFDDLLAGSLDRTIERRLFADHRLGFDDLAGAVTRGDRQHVPVDVGRRLGPEDRRAARSRVALEHLQPDVEVVERALADRARSFAGCLEVVQLDQRFAPLGDGYP